MFNRKECVDLDSAIQRQVFFKPRVLDSAVFCSRAGLLAAIMSIMLSERQVLLHLHHYHQIICKVAANF
jgi:hypothetical protein